MADDKTKWGVVVLGSVSLAAVLAFAAYTKNDAICPLSANAVGLIASGMRHGSGAEEIMTQAQEFAPDACEAFVATVVNNPQDQASFVLELPNGDIEQTVTGIQIASPPPPPQPGDLQKMIECRLGWDSDYLYEMCLDGRLFAPSS